jgi:RNA polymerase sigma factor (sigma-70 family)
MRTRDAGSGRGRLDAVTPVGQGRERAGTVSAPPRFQTPPPFQVFLEEQRAVVYRFLLAAVGPGEADDCFQETFLAALRAYPRLRNGSNLRAWVLTIATRKAIDAGRARARRPVPDEDAVRRAAERPSPSGEIGPERGDPLWDAVQELPPRQRAAVVHRYVLDRSYAEIAELMESSEETARANVSQGTKRLRARMEAREDT